MTAPAPIVYRPKSETADTPSQHEQLMLGWRSEAKQQAMRELESNPEYSEIQRYIDAIEGRQWSRERPMHRSRFVDNLIGDARLNALTQLTDIRSTIEVSQEQGNDFEQIAKICTNVIHDQWLRWDMDLTLARVVDHALFGAGYAKIDAASPGRLIMIPCGMDTVLPIQSGDDIQKSAAVLYRSLKSLVYFKERFGRAADGLEREAVRSKPSSNYGPYARPSHIPEYTWSAFSPAMQRWIGVRSTGHEVAGQVYNDPFPSVELEEYWIDDRSVNESFEPKVVKHPGISTNNHNFWYTVPPGGRLFPRKRLVIFAGNRMLYDGPSPYWHSFYPFARLCLNPVVWGPAGLSKYRNLMPFNRAVNEFGAGVNDLLKRALNPTLMTRKGAVADAVWRRFQPDMPGAKMMLNPVGNPATDVQYGATPKVDAWVFEAMRNYFLPRYQTHSGTLDVASLTNKRQIPGGDTIEQMKDTMPGHFRLEQRYIDAFLRDCGAQAVSHVFQFFTAKRRLQLLGANGIAPPDFDYDPNSMVPAYADNASFWKMFAVRISSGSLHGAATDRRKQMAIALAAKGLISRKELLRVLNWGNEDLILQELKEEAEQLAEISGRDPRMTRGQRNGAAV